MKEYKESDANLIRQIVGGDMSLFRLLVDRHKDISFSLACSIVKNNDEAQDVLQEAFIKAFRNLEKFNFNSSFSVF